MPRSHYPHTAVPSASPLCSLLSANIYFAMKTQQFSEIRCLSKDKNIYRKTEYHCPVIPNFFFFLCIYLYILIYPTICCGKLHSPQSPVQNTADRNSCRSHHVLKQSQYELQAIVGDGSETAIIIPNNWRDCFIWSFFWKATPVWKSQMARNIFLSVLRNLQTDKESPLTLSKAGTRSLPHQFRLSTTFQKYPLFTIRISLFCRNTYIFYFSNWVRRVTISPLSDRF